MATMARMRQLPVLLAVLLSTALLVGGCGGDDASKEEFAQDVIAARNDADAGLAQIVEASSLEDLLERMKTAAVDIRGAARDVREAPAPGELEDERDLLAERLLALSDEIISTVETFEAFPDQAGATRALNFEQWDNVQASLASLRSEGIDVPALGRHAAQVDQQ
jgi:hypothetical protein